VVFIEDLMPIVVEEMLSLNIFFSKKRKVVVRREVHHREGVPVKRHRVMCDRQSQEEKYFTTYVANSLGAFATTNQFSVGNVKEKLKKKDMLVNPLREQVKTMEQGVRREMNKGFEQIRAHDRQEIQHLKISLEEMQKNS
jgi:hypothetical protein